MTESKIHIETYLKKTINDESLNHLVSPILDSFHKLTLHKNDFLVEEGKVCKYFCFIESGILQHSIMVFGEEKTTYLGLKNTSTSALKSFTQNIPARKNIKALSDCKLWAIDQKAFKHLLENNPAFTKFYYNLIENQIHLIDDYRINLLTLSAEERYKKLLANDPELLQEVPLHYLASFLGISSRHMSRIRKNIN
ncbi:CRP-like cAMP-binding protein [Oceanihabitans sediminis]|uniref:Crp/Fnr family transcriptional regulator n=2 Tax=Oceanihabitans sediminis TaxID=1812012 RepID=A0A368P8U3_9FLAO|nr:CRP-like cAMP-binding protein [Oceanihabitans sediminis]RCU58524.1 Crp/Fnr family transcriptional regulator [Oceanihabitans sediminis]